MLKKGKSIGMIHSGLFAGRSARFQLLMLLFLVLSGSVVSLFISLGLPYVWPDSASSLYDSPDLLRLVQFFSAVCTFLLPSFGLAWLCSDRISHYLALRPVMDCKVWLGAFCGIVLLLPVISLFSWINQQMVLPSWLSSLEQWMRSQEELAQRLTDVLLSQGGVVALAGNLFVVALMAAVTEEFLFRGCLQRILQRHIANHHMAVWLAAFLFSAFHLQFFGFVPRLLLGAYLGYLLCWSRSIWLPVFAHFVNNALVVLMMSNDLLKQCDYVTGDFAVERLPYYVAVAVVALVLFVWSQTQLHHRCMMQR